MTLADKIRNLRAIEGSLRGLGRPMTQQEVSREMRKQFGKAISQSYLSQIESGGRPHLTHTRRTLLAKFFGVYPGFLVNDPEGYHTELISELRVREATLDSWLLAGAERPWSVKKAAVWWLSSSDSDGLEQAVLRAVINPDLA